MPITLAEVVRRLNDRPSSAKANGAPVPSTFVPDVLGLFDRLRRAFVPRTALDLIDERFPWARDQRLAMDPDVPEPERMAAIRRLAETVRWSPNPSWGGRELGAWNELVARAHLEGRSRHAVKADVLFHAVVLVLSHRDEVRRMRVGTHHGSFDLREADGGPTGVRPLDLPYSADSDVAPGAPADFVESPYRYWFRREVQKAATAILLEEPYPAPPRPVQPSRKRRSKAPDDPAALVDGNPSALAALLDLTPDQTDDPQIARALELATPVQRELLALKGCGLSTAAAARRRGMAPGTARVQLKLFHDKLRRTLT